ncbi:hypothetical protein T10_7884 [Trichinella papuae]|uniref:Uncharacterized protein n=1 Tax=Trichinella papuae TaxID=268474 RepID=A0A0V1N2H4_9BILA|nr:hypothetical protein T10_7884 [Trichinella papuae]
MGLVDVSDSNGLASYIFTQKRAAIDCVESWKWMNDIRKFKKTKRQCLQQELEEDLDKEDLETEIDEFGSLRRVMLEIRCIAEDFLDQAMQKND